MHLMSYMLEAETVALQVNKSKHNTKAYLLEVVVDCNCLCTAGARSLTERGSS